MNEAILDFWAHYRSRYIKPAAAIPGGYYVEMRTTNGGANDKSSSEATGYGMILSVLLAGGAGDADTRKYFDGFFRLFDRNRSRANDVLMSFTIGQDENTHDNSATDGDMDIAYALLMAHDQWGSSGAIDYLREARRIITDGIRKSDMGQASHRTLLGDWDKSGWNTRSSDWMAGHMLAFQKATGDAFWGEARRTIYTLISQIRSAHSPHTGLMPDFVVGNPPKAAPPKFLEKGTDGDYSWNACRFPLRMAVDFAHTRAPESKEALAAISKWVTGATGGNPSAIKAGYRLDGTPLTTESDMAFTAPLIASAIADASNQEFLDKGWSYLCSNRQDAYYGDSIALLTMLLLSGNWWAPGEWPN
jgi:endo-1,4-beta-D-glucanase Y